MAIKVYKSTQAGAPALTGQLGSIITLLDAVLVNGYNPVSITNITLDGSVATVTTSAAHGFATGDDAAISGVDQIEYNGEFVVTVVTPTTFTINVIGTPVSPATGAAMSVKRAPGGFSKVFTGTNKAVYQSNDLSSNRLFMRVLDDGGSTGGAGEARVWGFETMTNVDTGVGQFPTAAQTGTAAYHWRKSSTLDAVARAWMIVTDGKMIYYFNDYNVTAALGLSNGTFQFSGAFGDIISYRQGDMYSTIVTGNTSPNGTATNSALNGLFFPYTTITGPTAFASSMVIARDFTGVAGAKYVGVYASGLSGSAVGATAAIAYPHLIDNGFYLTPCMITQTSPALIRGRLPGCYEGLHGRCFNNLDTITGVQGMPDRTFMMVYGSNSTGFGHFMIDITGPWDS